MAVENTEQDDSYGTRPQLHNLYLPFSQMQTVEMMMEGWKRDGFESLVEVFASIAAVLSVATTAPLAEGDSNLKIAMQGSGSVRSRRLVERPCLGMGIHPPGRKSTS